jgi:diguanylate cyclase (GGDEF)-like protein
LAPGTTADEAVRLASRIHQALQQSGEGSPSKTTVSIGISDVAQLDSRVPEHLYAAADAALYQAKALGRNRAVVYTREHAGGNAMSGDARELEPQAR